ncbi:hypothetical protein [Paenibacillus cucumis (ex Kampfer et al. 2016)]|uniref:DUF551 domain-containing protein n=1 Tax=Paenibacillus cucumis (ex Kampfer et al. 2016) TaxID=1776858 RepID=A0ABS7KMC0_9BACL|nr:hypothetical protein [Paenibacillus cucumis (ex Kampfer et al. 2016)]MBY0205279.1 hypothetical protein [Paenibacillus cucumis (ex Kampfer et al. 2016)]
MIEWRKYDPTDRSIESHVPHLVTDGERVMVAVHAKRLEGDGYSWHRRGGYLVKDITHWVPINLPGEDT